jgi:hypothetical protein
LAEKHASAVSGYIIGYTWEKPAACDSRPWSIVVDNHGHVYDDQHPDRDIPRICLKSPASWKLWPGEPRV